MAKLNLTWDNLDLQAREEILTEACVQSRFAHYKWHEIDYWLRDIIMDSIELRSKGTVTIR